VTMDLTERKAARSCYREGFEEGRRKGLAVGQQRYGTFFEGTSIIIPTFNQRHLLKKCVGSILNNTDLPYEIIVVDNDSSDGTAAYLKGLGGQVRYRILHTNRGFAGAVNVGLMMAKGTTILLLHHDTLVTHSWLDNMLRCLNSDPHVGMVGPVTNEIAGDQRIRVSYTRTREISDFARNHNRPDPKRWRQTDRLSDFCLLFRRELFDQIGYFDERYSIGSYEGEDYSLRVRLLGKSLLTARDTFIHRGESVGNSLLGEQMQEINDHEDSFFSEKWNDVLKWMQNAGHDVVIQPGVLPNTAIYYPERILVQGMGPTVYWIENRERHPLRGTVSIPAVRVSQVDLRRWLPGEPIDYEVPMREFRVGYEPGGRLSGVVKLPDGSPYHVEGGKVRRVVSESAMFEWNLHYKPLSTVSPEELSAYELGLPIIAPPLLRQPL
jgi:O-antigen biosynthesis protein